VLEIAESYQDYSHIVKRPPKQRVLQNILHCHSALLVNVLCKLKLLVVLYTVPSTLDGLLVGEFIENAITTKYNVVVVLSNSK